MNRPTSSLWLRLALPFVAFVAIGSLALLGWLQREEKRESRELFAATARTNADFLRTQRLPATERTAEALGEVLGVAVFFPPGVVPDKETPAFSAAKNGAPGEVYAAGGGEAVRLPLEGATSLLLHRIAPATASIWQPRTLVVLGAFWGLSLGLVWLLARGIVGPLRTLAARLPKIAGDDTAPLPEAGRSDEIGQLARAYLDTRQQLATERRAREQAERLAALGRMATSLAHEINNPVAAIKLHAQLLEADLPPEEAERIRVILGENDKIESLVNQWMFLTRPQPPQLAPCDLGQLVAAAIRTHTPAADHAAVRIRDEITTPLPIHADRRRIAQALTNLLTNAIQATSTSGGEIRIAARIDHAQSKVHLTFTDTGPGFSEAALARATELFFSEKEGGMGIGLSVTAEILRAHGGSLQIANGTPHGAHITLTLPLADPTAL